MSGKSFHIHLLAIACRFDIIISHDRNICSGHIRGKRGISIDMRGSGTEIRLDPWIA